MTNTTTVNTILYYDKWTGVYDDRGNIVTEGRDLDLETVSKLFPGANVEEIMEEDLLDGPPRNLRDLYWKED